MYNQQRFEAKLHSSCTHDNVYEVYLKVLIRDFAAWNLTTKLLTTLYFFLVRYKDLSFIYFVCLISHLAE